MRVARIANENDTRVAFETHDSIRAFLDAHAERRSKPTPKTPPFTQADAEYAQKLHAMAERGTEQEAEVAKRKLEIGTPYQIRGRSKPLLIRSSGDISPVATFSSPIT
ncbi:hypothetical protein SAMN05421720_11740 [Rhodospira trueperi]|uniref:Uncharacterized protein n=1 Tax=Rhodospira trueperi TaxID=69960 RepID=A0A1G7H319_9PROT|nr:hypothetical protein SAMN05421720_11740 [Rhodospira trueperi]